MLKHVEGQKIRLEGFNNLTKSLSFNIYDICYARSERSQIEYLEYADREYDAKRLQAIIEDVTLRIGAKLVNVTTQDYDPRGASVVALLNEDHPVSLQKETSIVGHLDKSHITAHTYPEYDPRTGLATFRVDFDVSTCGMISPLRTLHTLIESFDSDIVIVDYRVRGFTRDNKGNKIFIDHDISSIQDFIDSTILSDYHAYDINILSEQFFMTKMRKKRLDLDNYLFGDEISDMNETQREEVRELIELEIQEIFECSNL
ncbi:MAG TPA: adenosylmethionine decarboxylase [Treponemataceae bacterium]|nr:adenosylmethionine decarboxylase [Treponemataceae bacterium]